MNTLPSVHSDQQLSICVRNCSPAGVGLSSTPGPASSFTVIESLNDASRLDASGRECDVHTHALTRTHSHALATRSDRTYAREGAPQVEGPCCNPVGSQTSFSALMKEPRPKTD
jgi:hypothetical protein